MACSDCFVSVSQPLTYVFTGSARQWARVDEMADFEPGKMNIDEQIESYKSFWTWTIRTCVIVIVIMIGLYLFRT